MNDEFFTDLLASAEEMVAIEKGEVPDKQAVHRWDQADPFRSTASGYVFIKEMVIPVGPRKRLKRKGKSAMKTISHQLKVLIFQCLSQVVYFPRGLIILISLSGIIISFVLLKDFTHVGCQQG